MDEGLRFYHLAEVHNTSYYLRYWINCFLTSTSNSLLMSLCTLLVLLLFLLSLSTIWSS